jgi:hypothetical protein
MFMVVNFGRTVPSSLITPESLDPSQGRIRGLPCRWPQGGFHSDAGTVTMKTTMNSSALMSVPHMLLQSN